MLHRVLSFVYDSVTGLLTFNLTVPRTFRFLISTVLEFDNQDIARDKLKMPLGVLAASQTSITPVNLFPRVKQIFISVDIIFGNFDTTSVGQQNFVIGLPVVGQHGTILTYKDDGDHSMHINFPVSQNIRSARIRLTDKNNLLIRDLVGFSWDLTLVVDTFELR